MSRWFLPDSLRARLLGVVIVCLAPPLAGALLYLERDIDRKIAAASDLTERLSEIGVRRHDQLIDQARNLLYVLALVPAIRDASPTTVDECVSIIRPLPQQADWTTGAWVADVNGDILCDTSGPLPGISLGDRPYFKRALETGDFVLSGYVVGRRSQKQIVLAVQPLMKDGAVHRVLGVSIELAWYNDLIKVSRDPAIAILVLDEHGVVLGHQPGGAEWLGRRLGDLSDVRRVLGETSGGFVGAEIDGTKRAWSFRPLGTTGTKLLVGVPTKPLEADTRRDMWFGLVVIAAAGLAGFIAIWWLFHVSILRWTRILADGAARIGDGGEAPPIDTGRAPREIAAVTTAFNAMSERLAARDRDLVLARQAAEGASERLTAVLESTSDNVIAVGHDWLITYANNRARAQLRDEKELAEREFWLAFPGARGSNFERQLRRCMAERVPVAFTEFFATRSVWYEACAFPSPEGLVLYFRDVTLRKRAEQTLRDAKEYAEVANRAKSEFLAAIGGGIRNPIAGMIDHADLLLETSLTADQSRHVHHMRDAGCSLLAIIDDVLDYSALEAGQLTLRESPVDLRELVRGCVAEVEPSAESGRLTMGVHLAPEIPPLVNGDGARIRQILINLLSNAVKFTDQGRVDIAVEPGPGGRTVFTVTDTGIGIPEERQRELFDRFTQIEKGRGGTGLGLAICRRLVELMGGSLGVRSRAGAGSSFWVALPLPPAALADSPTLVATDRLPLPPPPTASQPPNWDVPPSILVAEDVAMNRELVVALLRAEGYVVDAVADGAAAVSAARHGRHDLVLMDVEMPGLDGLEATRAIRSLPGHAASVPIIALTAEVRRPEIERCLAAGMNGHLGKPIDRNELLAAVRAVLGLGSREPSAPPTARPSPVA